MHLNDFDFQLPEELIALKPLSQRDSSRLLHVTPGRELINRQFQDLLSFFQPGDVLVLNNSKVLPAALNGVRKRDEFEARISVNLHKRHSDHQWFAFAKPLKRLKSGDRVRFGSHNQSCLMGALDATVEDILQTGEVLLAFDVSGAVLDEQLNQFGAMPLPPYIASRRAPDESDKVTYQTVYAKDNGSVAAPTAGLHFTDQLLEGLKAKGVIVEFVTLHVGAGTFLPVKTDNVKDHKMHSEWGTVSNTCVEAIKTAKQNGHSVTAVGTTSLRLLESAAQETGQLRPWQGETDIFITPGFDFKVVDRLITNFHLPKSTLFMLVSAFSGLNVMQKAYAHAIAQGYRFYSYGDACFLQRQDL